MSSPSLLYSRSRSSRTNHIKRKEKSVSTYICKYKKDMVKTKDSRFPVFHKRLKQDPEDPSHLLIPSPQVRTVIRIVPNIICFMTSAEAFNHAAFSSAQIRLFPSGGGGRVRKWHLARAIDAADRISSWVSRYRSWEVGMQRLFCLRCYGNILWLSWWCFNMKDRNWLRCEVWISNVWITIIRGAACTRASFLACLCKKKYPLTILWNCNLHSCQIAGVVKK